MADTSKIAEASMGIMESIHAKFGDDDDYEIVAIGIVAVVSKDDMTYERTYSTERIHHRAIGLFQVALDTVESGLMPEEIDGDED